MTTAASSDRIEANFAVLAGLSRGLSGGDILNVCLNAIHAGRADEDPAKWKVTQGMLEREIEKVMQARVEHGGKDGERVIGFWGDASQRRAGRVWRAGSGREFLAIIF